MVEPVVYTRENVVPVKPGDVIPKLSLIFYRDDHVRQFTVPVEVDEGGLICHYAPAPILELPPEPKEIPFGEAMKRIVAGEKLGWRLGADLGQVISLGTESLVVSRPGQHDAMTFNFRMMSQGTFYELPDAPTPTFGIGDTPEEAMEYAVEATGSKVVDEYGNGLQPKYTGLKWWEAIEGIRGTDKSARPVGTNSPLCQAHWNIDNILVNGHGRAFYLSRNDTEGEWEIVR